MDQCKKILPNKKTASSLLTLSKLKYLRLRGWNLLHVSPGYWIPSCVGVNATEAMTVTYPESHAHCAFANGFAHSLNLTDTVKIFEVWRCTSMHIDNTVNGFRGITFCTIKRKVPTFAAGIAVVDAKRAIPEHAQSSIIGTFFENTFVQEFYVKRKMRRETSPKVSKCP